MIKRIGHFAVACFLTIYCTTGRAAVFGEWATDFSGPEFVYAFTTNDSGGVLGQYCYFSSGNCIWLISMSSGCEEGHDYPVLANSDAGASQVMVYCSSKMEGQFVYVFRDFEAIDKLVKDGHKMGFAVPLQEDRFTVVRFHLDGAGAALSSMRSFFKQHSKSKPADSTKDQDL